MFKIVIVTIATFFSSCIQSEDCENANLTCVLEAFENDGHDDLHSVIIIQNNAMVAEKYYSGGDNKTLVDVRSAGKSVTSLIFGIALEQGKIESLDDPVSKYWPEAKKSAIESVKLTDLLTMRSGLDADANNPDSPGYEDKMDASHDTLAFALAVPQADEPGTLYRYNSLSAFITGVVISRATGRGMESFARDHLFKPLKITRWDWQEDRAGITKGQGNLFLTARGFARIGEMVLNGGTYESKQVVSKEWIKQSLIPRVDISNNGSNPSGYGYFWYQQSFTLNNRTIEMYFASGNGGNKIYMIPEFSMVVAIMSRAYGQGRGHRRSRQILEAILTQLY